MAMSVSASEVMSKLDSQANQRDQVSGFMQ